MLQEMQRRRTRKTRARSAASRRRAPASGGLRGALEGLEQRHYDLIGLALVAAGVYLAFVLVLGWDGGRVGGWLAEALEHAVGRLAYLAPIALFAGGVALIARPMLEVGGARWAGLGLLLFAVLLLLSADPLGIGPERPRRDPWFDPAVYTARGGIVGEAFYWATTQLFQRVGAQILAVFALAGGLLLLSGTTIAGLLRSAGGAAERAREQTREMAQTVRRAAPRRDHLDEDDEEIRITRVAATETLATEPAADPEEPAWDTEPAQAEAEAGGTTQLFDYELVHGAQDDEDAVPAPDRTPDEAAHSADVAGPADDEDVPRTPMGKRKEGITTSDEIDYVLPSPKLLERGKGDTGPDPRDAEATAKALLEALAHFGVEARMLGMVSGPHVSRYELQLAPGTKVGKVAQLKDDLAYALASTDIRILAPIPGKKAVGVEVPNQRRRLVRLGDIYEGRPKSSSPLVCWLGKDVSGQAVWTDIALMPHLLVAGTTGSGKSGCINAILCSILLHASPNECRFVLVDPKRVELNHYENLPHLLTPVVTNPRLAANVLANLIGEMESRYQVMGEARARNLAELNKARRRAGERPLPHILCVIDELADLMMVAPAEVEDSIIRLAQKSRAVGIHLVLATQRPSTDVITGTIKVNIPARIAFAVASQVDSRVILDQGGAETLLGQGDMLFRPIGTSKLQRIQGAFVTEDEIARLTGHWAKQGEPDFDPELLQERSEESGDSGGGDELSPDQDDLLEDAARIVVESGTASVSMIQRRLRVGYTRAGRLIDMLERRGIISGYEGSKPRQVLVSAADLPRILGGEAADGGASSAEGAEAAGEGANAPGTASEPVKAS
jgi:S-DNA-T family DNA segregation ATPase FtsK/SpoIIIE